MESRQRAFWQVPSMKIGVFSHCAIDTILVDGTEFERIGGAACYASLTARVFGANVLLATRFGSDFPVEKYLGRGNIAFSDALSPEPTTRFRIVVNGANRDLFLLGTCDEVPYQRLDADGTLVSPIFGEVSQKTLGMIKRDSSVTMLDPQGFVRKVDQTGRIYLAETDLDVTGVTALKAGVGEMACIAGGSGTDAMIRLRDRGVEHVLLTDSADITALSGGRFYSLRLPNKQVHDTTGVGDIFCTAFLCTMIRERDFLWALCFAAGAAQAALDSRDVGLGKIPGMGQIETNASYFYNTVGFRQA